jgi:hypothetical protein
MMIVVPTNPFGTQQDRGATLTTRIDLNWSNAEGLFSLCSNSQHIFNDEVLCRSRSVEEVQQDFPVANEHDRK